MLSLAFCGLSAAAPNAKAKATTKRGVDDVSSLYVDNLLKATSKSFDGGVGGGIVTRSAAGGGGGSGQNGGFQGRNNNNFGVPSSSYSR